LVLEEKTIPKSEGELAGYWKSQSPNLVQKSKVQLEKEGIASGPVPSKSPHPKDDEEKDNARLFLSGIL
jgi:uncharacterized protein (DUF2236 family)